MLVNRDDYVKEMMDQHLSHRSTYEIITKEEADEFLSEASSAFIDCVFLKGNGSNSNDVKHIMVCLDQDTRLPVTHGLGKLHKGKFSPPPCGLVVAIVGSQFLSISRWVDAYLKELLPFCKTYIKNSDDVLRILRDFGFVCVTTFDSEAMCPNINTEEGLTFIMASPDTFIFKVKPG